MLFGTSRFLATSTDGNTQSKDPLSLSSNPRYVGTNAIAFEGRRQVDNQIRGRNRRQPDGEEMHLFRRIKIHTVVTQRMRNTKQNSSNIRDPIPTVSHVSEYRELGIVPEISWRRWRNVFA